jgi:hypothetical protein
LGGNTSLSLDTAFTNARYLQLGGGTLTGALNGTTASFSGGLSAASFTGDGSALTNVTAATAANALALGGNPAASYKTTAQNDLRYLQLSGGTLTGGLVLGATGTANAGAGANSNPQDWTASVFNSNTGTAQPQFFRWQTEAAGNNTANPNGSFNLLFSGTGNNFTPTETGLSIAGNGRITFAPGQTFPAAGLPAAGGDLNGTLSNATVVGLQGRAVTNTAPNNGQVLQFNGAAWAPATLSGAGTVTSVGSGLGLTGGPITNSGTLAIDTNVVPQLGAGNTFTAANLFAGGAQHPPLGTATPGGGFSSSALDLTASSYNSGAGSAVNQRFRWQAEPVNNNSNNASGSLNLLFAAGNNTLAETGLSIANNGQITFAGGQTFPGSVNTVSAGDGSITIGGTASAPTVAVANAGVTNSKLANPSLTVNAGAGLSGGGSVALGGSTTLSIASAGVTNSMLQNSSVTVNTGSGLSGGGTLALGGTLSLSNTGVLSVSASAPLTSTGGANPSINLGIVPIANGGTGITTAPVSAGQYLRSSGAGTWAVGSIQAGDVPSLSAAYVDLISNQSIAGNKTFTQTTTAAVGDGITSALVATASDPGAAAILGQATDTTVAGSGTGVMGTTSSPSGIAVAGLASDTSAPGFTTGVLGRIAGPNGFAVNGVAADTTGTGFVVGVHGVVRGPSGSGVYGVAKNAGGTGGTFANSSTGCSTSATCHLLTAQTSPDNGNTFNDAFRVLGNGAVQAAAYQDLSGNPLAGVASVSAFAPLNSTGGVNPTISLSGIVSITNGGTGSATQSFVDLNTNQNNIAGNKTFTGSLTGVTASFTGTTANQIVAVTQNGTGSGIVSNTSSTTNTAAAVAGNATGTTGDVYGVYGTSASTGVNAAGVYGTSPNYGVYGTSPGYGVFGSSSSIGVVGVGNGSFSYGVEGSYNNAAGSGYGGVFIANGTSGSALYASGTGSANGMTAFASAVGGTAVLGQENATTGVDFGVRGITSSAAGNGVLGDNNASTGAPAVGVQGRTFSTTGVGVLGNAAAAGSGADLGVEGASASTAGTGVLGVNAAASGATVGVQGQVASAGGTAGVFNNTLGGKILSAQNNGVEKAAIDGLGNVSLTSITSALPNQNPTGTTVRRLAKWTVAGAIIPSITDTSGMIGIVVSGAGTAGSAQIAVAGQAFCDFDSSTNAGDYVTASAVTAGMCHDAGFNFPANVQVVGRVRFSAGGANTNTVILYPPEQSKSAVANITATAPVVATLTPGNVMNISLNPIADANVAAGANIQANKIAGTAATLNGAANTFNNQQNFNYNTTSPGDTSIQVNDSGPGTTVFLNRSGASTSGAVLDVNDSRAVPNVATMTIGNASHSGFGLNAQATDSTPGASAVAISGTAFGEAGTGVHGEFNNAIGNGTAVGGMVFNSGVGAAAIRGQAFTAGSIGGVFQNTAGGEILSGRNNNGEVFSVDNNGNMNVGNASNGPAAITTSVLNEGTTGTTLNRLAKLTGAPSTAIQAAATDTSGMIGIVIANAATTGNAQIAIIGQANCQFDGTPTVAGDYVIPTTAIGLPGDCHDAGPKPPASVQIIGRVLASGAGLTTQPVVLFGPEQRRPDPPMMFSVYIAANPNGNYGRINPDQAITVTRVTGLARTASTGCASPYQFGVFGIGAATLANGSSNFDSGPVSINVAAGTAFAIVAFPGAGCTTTPADINASIEYKLQ